MLTVGALFLHRFLSDLPSSFCGRSAFLSTGPIFFHPYICNLSPPSVGDSSPLGIFLLSFEGVLHFLKDAWANLCEISWILSLVWSSEHLRLQDRGRLDLSPLLLCKSCASGQSFPPYGTTCASNCLQLPLVLLGTDCS